MGVIKLDIMHFEIKKRSTRFKPYLYSKFISNKKGVSKRGSYTCKTTFCKKNWSLSLFFPCSILVLPQITCKPYPDPFSNFRYNYSSSPNFFISCKTCHRLPIYYIICTISSVYRQHLNILILYMYTIIHYV